MKNIFVAMVFGALFGGLLAGCAKFEILPQNITLYSKGVKIIQSQKQDSKVQLEIAQRDTLCFMSPHSLIHPKRYFLAPIMCGRLLIIKH